MPHIGQLRVTAVAVAMAGLAVGCVATGDQALVHADIVQLSTAVSITEEILYPVVGARTEKFDVCFSADGDRIAYVLKTAGSWTVFVDGMPGMTFEKLFGEGWAFELMPGFINDCADYVYAGLVEDTWHWMVNNESKKLLDEKPKRENFVGRSYIEYHKPLDTHSPDAFVVDENRERYVVVDGEELKHYHVGSAGGVAEKSVVFLCSVGQAPDCEFERDGPIPPVFRDTAHYRVAYRVKNDGDIYYVIDEVEYGPYDELEDDLTVIRFSPDGRHFAFVGRRDSRAILNVDGVDSISTIAFQFNALHTAFPFRFTDSNTIRYYAIRNGSLAQLTVSVPQ